MDKPRARAVFVCQQCGREELKWLGRCPICHEWNSFAEITVAAKPSPARRSAPASEASELSEIVIDAAERSVVPLGEFNRVLGGGLVPGSMMLMGGEPGIGKSTLLLQVAALLAGTGGSVVYVTGEETLRQVKLRAQRLGIIGQGLFLLAETDLDSILEQVERQQPSLVDVDSIQTAYLSQIETLPGSIAQVRECTIRLMQWAKAGGVPVFITGHVTKEGAIAGPRVL